MTETFNLLIVMAMSRSFTEIGIISDSSLKIVKYDESDPILTFNID